jgi:hypothetical protein
MTTFLGWPNIDVGLNMYAAYNGFQADSFGVPQRINDTSYFRMKQFSESNNDIVTDLDFSDITYAGNKLYHKMFYIDLDEDCSIDDEDRRIQGIDPFITYSKPYTIDITMKIHIPDDDQYFNKSRVYFALGQNVPGIGGNVITIGTNADTKSGYLNDVPVIGIITKSGCIKSIPTVNAESLIKDNTYRFKLIYNPSSSHENKLILFVQNITAGKEEVVQSTGLHLPVYNFEVIKPRLYFFTSGWTNEYGWGCESDGAITDVFDYAYASIIPDVLDYAIKPIIVTRGVSYSIEYILDSLKDLEFEEPSFSYESDEVRYVSSDTDRYVSHQSGSTLIVYTSE